MNLPEVTKLVFVSFISKQIKLNDYNRCFWMWCPFPEFIAFFFFGIFSAWHNTSTRHNVYRVGRCVKTMIYSQIKYLLLLVTDPNNFLKLKCIHSVKEKSYQTELDSQGRLC